MCRVLIADGSSVMRTAIRKTLEEERGMAVVGEAASFGQAVQMINDFKPDVLLLDLHLAEKRGLPPDLVKSQLGTVCTLAVSFLNGAESKALAESYGAINLLDKMNLYTQMIPAIRLCCSAP